MRTLTIVLFAATLAFAQSKTAAPKKPERTEAPAATRQDTGMAIREQVSNELQIQLRAMEQRMRYELVQQLKSELKQELKSELRQELRMELRMELMQELRNR
jgi:hypothetical protein